MTPQSTFMIVAVVPDEKKGALRKLLATMNKFPGHADPDNSLVPFNRLGGLHMARFVIIEPDTDITDEIKAFGVTPRPWQPTLAFLGDIDGDRDTFLADLVKLATPGLEKIFSLCEGFIANETDLLAWMKTHDIQSQANYINWIGRTVKQVHEEAALHNSLSRYLQQIVAETGSDKPRDLRQKLLSFVELEKYAGRLTLTPPEATPCAWKIRNLVHLIGVPLIFLLLSPFFLLMAPFFAIRLRMQERTDPELFIRPKRHDIEELSVHEDLYVTNQYCLFGDVKPGVLRLLIFKFFLLILNYLARHVYNRGFLTRIRTIHFARWVLMDNNHRLFFASNYDGGHESYMDDFINKAGWGINLVFFSGVSYPTTRWLIKDGASREQQFKYAQRRHQIGTEVWYKAYLDLTATDLSRNSRIRKGVEIRQSNDDEIRAWLRLI